jgi:hypothetical protein
MLIALEKTLLDISLSFLTTLYSFFKDHLSPSLARSKIILSRVPEKAFTRKVIRSSPPWCEDKFLLFKETKL